MVEIKDVKIGPFNGESEDFDDKWTEETLAKMEKPKKAIKCQADMLMARTSTK